MTQSLTLVVLSSGLTSFKEIRAALSTDSRAQLLAGGNDAEQVQEEIVRLKPTAAIITLGANPDQAIKLIEKLVTQCPNTAIISAAQNASGELILQSLRAGAREFLNLPIKPTELKTVFDRISELSVSHVDISQEFELANLEIRVGREREEALRNLAERTGVDDLRSLVAMLIQTDRFGTSIAKAIRVFSDSLRTKRRQRAEQAAQKAAVKLLFPLACFLFPTLFIAILGPALIQLMDTLGHL